MTAGRVNFLLQGILYADGVSTVSPTYAREIQRREVRRRASTGSCAPARPTVVGILNGVDYDEWSPERDRHIPHRYSARDLAGKERDKRAPADQRSACPTCPGCRVLGVVSRLVGQKGFKLLDPVMPELLRASTASSSSCSAAASRRSRTCSRGCSAQFPRQVCFYQRLQQRARAPDRGRRRHVPDAVALRAVRPEPAVQPALRHRADRAPHRRARRHGAARGTRAPARAPASSSSTHDAAGLRWAIEAALVDVSRPAPRGSG